MTADYLGSNAFEMLTVQFERVFARATKEATGDGNPFQNWDSCVVSLIVESKIHEGSSKKYGVVRVRLVRNKLTVYAIIANTDWYRKSKDTHLRVFLSLMQDCLDKMASWAHQQGYFDDEVRLRQLAALSFQVFLKNRRVGSKTRKHGNPFGPGGEMYALVERKATTPRPSKSRRRPTG